MEDKQKRVIIKSFAILGVIISLGISIAWLVFILDGKTSSEIQLEEILGWLFANFGSMTLGIIIKVWINNRHKKEITKIVNKKNNKSEKKEIKHIRKDEDNYGY